MQDSLVSLVLIQLRFGVINDTIHAPNERTSIDEVQKLYMVFKKFIKEFLMELLQIVAITFILEEILSYFYTIEREKGER